MVKAKAAADAAASSGDAAQMETAAVALAEAEEACSKTAKRKAAGHVASGMFRQISNARIAFALTYSHSCSRRSE